LHKISLKRTVGCLIRLVKFYLCNMVQVCISSLLISMHDISKHLAFMIDFSHCVITNMKKLVFVALVPVCLQLLPFALTAQQKMDSYTAAWKKIDSLISKKGLTKSALEEVKKIYARAKKEKEDAQLIKSLLYQLNLEEQIEEDAEQNGIKFLEKEIAAAEEPARSVMHSLIGQKYWQFAQNNRWVLYDRTQTVQFNKDDINTWGIQDFHNTISYHYLNSIRNKTILNNTKPEKFDAIIIKGNVRYLRPTLYDLLCHEALEYFENDEKDITKPAYAFVIEDKKAFSTTTEFVQVQFQTRDTGSLHHKALLIYQELIASHLADKNPDALIDLDLSRLQFVHRNAIMDDKDDLYMSALESIINRYPNDSAATQASYLLAQHYFETGSRYDPQSGKTADRYAWQKAKQICENTIRRFPASEGAASCNNLINQLLRKELLMQTERVNVPDLPFRTLVSFRNFSKLYYRIFPVNEAFFETLRDRWNDNYWKKLVSQKPIRSLTQELPGTDDLRTHSVEIKIDALPVGHYALLASTNPDFSFEQNPLAVQYFHVSNISYINYLNDYFILHRETGKPLGSATVQVWRYEYDYASRRQKANKSESLIADLNGYVALPTDKRSNQNLRLEIGWKNDRLFLDEQYYPIYRLEEIESTNKLKYEKDNRKTFLFTDRSIYRPGQTVYFKGIVLTKDFDSRKHVIIPNFKTIIRLHDSNGEKVDSLVVTSNEYGSFSGKFTLPSNLLNGEFSLEDLETGGSVPFSVEEYKRPKFYVQFNPVTGVYRLNDSITITGSSIAYSGNAIDGANVKFRVVREARFPYPWLLWRWGFPRSSSMEITNGEIQTSSDGKFSIRFKAIPDNSINKDFAPVFEYKVIADVTDINGETRSSETEVTVGYKALDLQIGLPQEEIIQLDSLKKISVSTKNLAGQFEPTVVNISIFSLEAPGRLIRPRYWNEPDTFLMSKEEYLRYFPLDEYKDESKRESWKKLEKVVGLSDTTQPNSQFLISNSQLKSGWYVIEASAKDRYGEEVKAVKYVMLYDPSKNVPPSPDYYWTMHSEQTKEPGESAALLLGSSADDLFVIQGIDRKSGKSESPKDRRSQSRDPKFESGKEKFDYPYTFLTLNKETKSLSFSVNENDRGGFGVMHAFVKHNRLFSNVHTIHVPWSNKELNISYTTWRDKTQPGSKEQWKVKISGKKGERLASEILTGMYDASLDQFKPHSWSKPDIYENYFVRNSWQGRASFAAEQSQQRWYQDKTREARIKQYDAFIWQSGFGIYHRDLSKRTMVANEVAAPVMADSASYSLSGKVAGVAIQDSKDEKITESTVRVDNSSIQIRKNFNETAFFFPELKTDTEGNVEFTFTIPEALTQWKWQIFAHTKDLAFGLGTQTIITQKELMVQPNVPRFFREGDQIDFSAKISNLSKQEITGQAQLEFIDAITMQPVDGWFKNLFPVQHFTASASQSTAVKFQVEIPYNYNKPLLYRIVAKTGNLSDGEENILPVLTNRMLITETLPIQVKGAGTKNFTFEKLSGNKSESLTHYSLTVEYTSNPAWYAVQSLPYLMEFPYDCAEQVFNRYYANALATTIANSSPKIKSIFEKWKTTDSAALLSNLQKNEELKSVLLQETPWVLEAKTESQQKKNIALLFDLVRMSGELNGSFEKLKQLQSGNGGLVWFKGGPDDRFITQYVLAGIGRLKKLSALPVASKEKMDAFVKPALEYAHKRIKDDYDELIKKKIKLDQNNLNYTQIQYIYLLGFFKDHDIPGQYIQPIAYYHNQAKKYWLRQNRYMQGMIALALYRSGDSQTARAILASLKENAIQNETMGMYWKDNVNSFYWHQAPIETQALLIEAFSEITKDAEAADNMKIWLLNQKRTQNWETTKATADACYALLLRGTNLLFEEPNVEIKLGNLSFSSTSSQAEEGTGYFKKTIDGKDIKPELGNISVLITNHPDINRDNQSTNQLSWGAVYWQYFENLDKITKAASPLSITKKLFIEKNSPTGPVLVPLNDGDELKVGDKLKVRIELRSDRDMEYLHLKDMRASGVEPINVLSSYKWQGGLGYYETTKDASTNFFFDWMRKGTYVFEYPMFVTHTGNFSVGVATIQCMYAPEFSSHSEGIRIRVNERKN
jgi:Bacterial Alpha-2-macroglobulin MG10 domain/Alpha-2-macroglobulin family/MG2 domain